MKIGVVRNNVPREQMFQNKRIKNSQISFGQVKDVVEIANSKDAKNELSELLKRHDSLMEEIKKESQIHKQNTAQLFSKAVEIQEKTKNYPVSFDDFQNLVKSALKPLDKILHSVDDIPITTRLLQYGWGDDIAEGPSYLLFQSKDKELASDMIDLYSFYSKARWNQEYCSNHVMDF